MMKTVRLALAALALVLACLWVRPAYARAPGKLTLMVYMCGSNLESGYGSASADLQEMIGSGFDADQVSLLIMTGGAQNWRVGFDPSGLAIHEVGRRGLRDVWRGEASSMGAPETLTALLDFGVARYPAERYALIVWDHGGGPMEGVCWDELFSMDNLSLSELTRALEASDLPGKLSWIGFDACLMGNAEVAAALAPYADYMVASQETEPNPGWNYAFLKRIEDDAGAEATGRRIIDAYFEGMADIRDTVTLACIDLSEMPGVVSAMDDFFTPVSKSLDAESFVRLSELRMAAVNFGRSARGVGGDSYDLVDLAGLVRAYGDMPEFADGTDRLLNSLSRAVVCCRSSEEGAGGLSVYHPYANKEKYALRWRGDYQKLDFSAGYRDYLNRFGGLLTGGTLADWSGLPAPVKDGDTYSLRLTQAQAANCGSAQLYVLGAFRNSVYRVSYVPLYIGKADLGPDGLLTATYSGRALYVTDPDGNPIDGPLGVFPGDRPGRYSILTHYLSDNEIISSVRGERVVYQFDEPTGGSGMVETLIPRIWDDVSQTYTNRIPFAEEEFSRVGFWRDLRYKPEGEGTLPGFSDWERINGLNYSALFLPQPWKLRFMDDQLTGTRFHVTFQITDLQQNRYCTPLISVENGNLGAVGVTPDAIQNDAVRLELSAEMKASPLESGMDLTWRMTNLADTGIEFTATPIILNGRRMTARSISNGTFGLVIAPGETAEGLTSLFDTELEGLESIDSVGFDVTVKVADSADVVAEFPVRVRVAGCGPEALARVTEHSSGRRSIRSQTIETEYGRFSMTAQPDGSGLTMIMNVENISDTACDFSANRFYLDKRQAYSYWDFRGLEPGLEGLRYKVIRRNDAFLYGLDRIDTILCEMEVTDAQTREVLEAPTLCFEFDGLDIAGLAPSFYTVQSEAEAGGVRWQLLSLLGDDTGRLRGVLCVTNTGEVPIEDENVLVSVNGVKVYSGSLNTLNLRPGTSQIWSFDTMDDYSQCVYHIGFDPDSYYFNFENYLPLDHLLSRHGFREITSISFTPEDESLADARATLTLPEPFALRGDPDAMAMPGSAAILEGDVRAQLYAVAVGSKGIGLSVEFANDTDENVWLCLKNASVGGHEVDFDYGDDRFLLPAHTVFGTALSVRTGWSLEEGTAIDELSFEFDWGSGVGTAAISGLGCVQGSGQGVFLTPDGLKVSPARIGG